MEVSDAIRERRAFRALVRKPISNEVVERLAEAARLSPSALNMQPWRFVFATDHAVIDRLSAALPDYNMWAKNASLIIAVCSSESMDAIVHEDQDVRRYVAHPSEFGESPERPMWLYDVGIASAFIMLQATALGLVAHPIGGYMESGVREVLGVPDEMTICALLICGTHTTDPAVIAALPEDLRADETKRPERLAIDRFVYRDRYGAAVSGGS
jgi:nitroreductase